MILGVHHIGLTVAKISQTKWLHHIGGEPKCSWVECPNVWVLLRNTDHLAGQFVRPRPVNLPGLAHICLQSRDINEGLNLGLEAGLLPISGPVDLGTQFRYLYAHTGDGVLLELEGAPFVRDVIPRFWVGHVAFVANDIVALVEFYGRALGLTPSAVSRLRPNPVFDKVTGLEGADLSAMWLPGLNLGLEFWQYHNPPAPIGQAEPVTGFTYVCFESNDFDTDCANVLAQGATSDADEDLGLSNCTTACFKDPEGNRFALIAFDDTQDPMAVANLPYKDLLATIAAQHPAAQKG
jgi:catechol 2,3-dioxygenase-like lactoylglutathione lyase family enzyme